MLQKELENFLRIAILIVHHVTLSLRTLIELELKQKKLKFEDFINNYQHEIYHLCYNTKRCCRCSPCYVLQVQRILYPSQLELILDKNKKFPGHTPKIFPPFCCSEAKPGISTDILDVTLCRTLLVNFCTDIFWYNCTAFQGVSFEDFLNQHKHDIYHLCHIKTPCCQCPTGYSFPTDRQQIFQADWNTLFTSLLPPCINCRKRHFNALASICSVSATPGISPQHLNKALQNTILQYCCSLRKTVFKLVEFKNIKYSHIDEAQISDADFGNFKRDIETGIIEIAKVCGEEQKVRQSLQDLQKRVLDASLCQQYQTFLYEHINRCDNLKDDINDIGMMCKRIQINSAKIPKLDKRAHALEIQMETANNAISCVLSDTRTHTTTTEGMQTDIKSIQKTVRNVQKNVRSNTYTGKKVAAKVTSIKEAVDRVSRNVKDLTIDTRKIEHCIKTTEERIDSVEAVIGPLSQNIKAVEIAIPQKVTKELSRRSKLIELTKLEISSHIDEGTFVETPVVAKCVTYLDEKNVLVIAGTAGVGKSRNGIEILRQFKGKNDEYDVVKLSDLHDFVEVSSIESNILILIEDIFGRTNNVFNENADIGLLDTIHACVKNGNVKVIFTIRNTIKQSCQGIFSSKRLFFNKVEVDLDSKEFKLTTGEKGQVFLNYCKANNVRIVGMNEQENYEEESILDRNVIVIINKVTFNQIIQTEPLLGFPETCYLFTQNRKFTRLGAAFFKHPSQCLTNEIDNLRKVGKKKLADRMKYVTLVYILLNGDSCNIDQINSQQIEEIINSCFGDQTHGIWHESEIIDAVYEMKGHFVTCKNDTNIFNFQHQTVLESLLISYSKVNPTAILSRLTFDFIREIVRLQGYVTKEGEVVLKVCSKYYTHLAKRIINILETDYKNRSLSLIQLLCASEIMKENDSHFIQCLLAEAHESLPLRCSQTFVTYLDKCETVNFYFPAALFEHIVKEKHMTDALRPILQHMKKVLLSDTTDIIYTCRLSLLAALSYAVQFSHGDKIVNQILSTLNECNIPECTKEYVSDIIHLIIRQEDLDCLLNNFEESLIELKLVFFKVCNKRWTTILSLLSKRNQGYIFSLDGLVEEMCRSQMINTVKTLISKLTDHGNTSPRDYNDIDIVEWILQHVDCSQFTFKMVLNEACSGRSLEIVTWITDVFPIELLDLQDAFNIACGKGCLDIVKYCNCHYEADKFELQTAMIKACIEGHIDVLKYLVEAMKCRKIDLKSVKQMLPGKPYALKWVLKNVNIEEVSDFTQCIRKATETERMEIVHWLINSAENALFGIDEAMYRGSVEGNMNVITWLLNNSFYNILNMDKILEKACDKEQINMCNFLKKCCQLPCVEIAEQLLKNIDHKLLDIPTVLFEMFENIKSKGKIHWNIIKLFTDFFYAKIVLHGACQYELFDVIQYLVSSINHTKLNLQSFMEESFKTCNNFKIYKFVLDHVNNFSFDVSELLRKACHDGQFETIRWLISQVDHSKLHTRPTIYESLLQNNVHFVQLLEVFQQNKCIYLLYVKAIAKYAIIYGRADIVEWLVTYTDKLNMQSVIEIMQQRLVLEFEELNTKWTKVTLLLLEKVGVQHRELIDTQTVMEYACCYGCKKIVEWLVTNIDHRKLGIQSAMDKLLKRQYNEYYYCSNNNAKNQVMSLLLNEIGVEIVELCNVERIMEYFCCHGWLEKVEWLLTNIDHRKLGIQSAMNKLLIDVAEYNCSNESVIQIMSLLLKKIGVKIKELCNMEGIMENACYAELKIVEFLLTNIDHKKLGIQFAVIQLMTDGVDDEREVQVMNLIPEEIGAEIVELCNVEQIMECACCYDCLEIVEWLVRNIDHRKLRVQSAMDRMMESKYNDDGRGFQVMNLLLKEIGADIVELCNVEHIMEYVCCHGLPEIVEWLLINIDHMKLRVRSAMEKLLTQIDDDDYCDQSDDDDYCDQQKSEVLSLLLHSIGANIVEWYNVQEIMKYGCCKGSVKIVEWLWVNCAEHINITIAIQNTFYNYQNIPSKDIIKYFLDNVDHSLLDMIYIMNESCHFGLSQIVKWLLEHKDKRMFDMKRVFEQACYHNDLDLVKYIYENNTTEQFDFRRAMNKSCRNKRYYDQLDTVQWLWENCDHKYFDMECAMNNASRYGNIEIIEWISGIADTTAFKMNIILNNACRHGQFKTAKWIVNTIEIGQLDFQQTAKEACLSHKNEKDILELIVNINNRPLLNLNRIIDEACKHGKTSIVELLLKSMKHNDILDVDQAMKYVLGIDAHVNTTDNRHVSRNESEKQQLVHTLLKRDHLSLDLNEVFLKSCSTGWLNIIEWLWSNVDKDLLDVRFGINLSCEYVKPDVLKWALLNVNLNKLDLETIMIESCGCGWCDHVRWIWKNEKKYNKIFDMKSAVEEACTYGRFNVLKWIVDTVDRDRYDIATVMYASCKNGWLDIVNWVIQHADRNQYNIKVAIGESITYGQVKIVETLFTTLGAEYFDLEKLSLSMCSQSSHKDVVLFILKNIEYNELDMTAIVKKACWDGWTDVVEFVLDKVPHDKIDWKEPLLNTCLSGESQISQLILDNISHDKFDVRLAMIFVCRRGWEEIASLLLEKVDHSKFDFHESITEANRFGETDIIKIIFQKVSCDILDVKAAVNLLCTNNTNEYLILWILKQVNIALLDYDSIQEKAREHNWSRLEFEMKKML